MNTREKIGALISEARKFDGRDADAGTKRMIEAFQIMEGLGFDVLGWLLPESDAEADQQVDNLIALLLQIRGDDLPPFNFERHVLEATATDPEDG